jgi:hypothetical protein
MDQEESVLRKRHPCIDDELWRAIVRHDRNPERVAAQMAADLYDRIQRLRAALQDPETPAWKAAALGIAYQDMVQINLGPHNASTLGKIHGGDKRPRRARDELCLRVMRSLKRDRGLTWPEAFAALESAALNGNMINRVEIEQDGDCWKFSKKDQAERFKTSTLRVKKFRKV